MLRLVPFHDGWITHERLNVNAIYRRPRFVQDQYGDWQREYDEHGLPTWDLTTPLPVRGHNKWRSKGFEYITLADRGSLVQVAKVGMLIGGTVSDYDQSQAGGPWNYRKYAESQQDTNTAELEMLRADVAKFGADAVEAIHQRSNPYFRLPEALRATKPTRTRKDTPETAA